MRNVLVAMITSSLVVAIVGVAVARRTEIKAMDNTVVPTCPGDPCLAVVQTSGIQVKVGDDRKPVVARREGRLVSFTVKLGKPDAKQIKFYDSNFGRGARARITVLKPGKSSRYTVTGQSEDFSLTRYFGRTVEFPLKRSLTVKKGYAIAITVPTWAPILSVGPPGTEAERTAYRKANAWRASRAAGACDAPFRQTAQRRRGGSAEYRCLYRARLAYSAQVISTP